MTTTDALRQQTLQDEEIPKLVRKFLSQGAPLEDIRLNAWGQWFHRGEPFINKKLSLLFHRSLHQTAKGTWYLHIKPYTYPVTVELTHRFIDRIRIDHASTRAHFIGDDPEQWTTIDLGPLYTNGDTILALTHDNAPTRIVGGAYRTLLDTLTEHEGVYSIRPGTHSLALSPLPTHFFDATASKSAD